MIWLFLLFLFIIGTIFQVCNRDSCFDIMISFIISLVLSYFVSLLLFPSYNITDKKEIPILAMANGNSASSHIYLLSSNSEYSTCYKYIYNPDKLRPNAIKIGVIKDYKNTTIIEDNKTNPKLVIYINKSIDKMTAFPLYDYYYEFYVPSGSVKQEIYDIDIRN